MIKHLLCIMLIIKTIKTKLALIVIPPNCQSKSYSCKLYSFLFIQNILYFTQISKGHGKFPLKEVNQKYDFAAFK